MKDIEFVSTEEDMVAGRLMGATGCEVMEAAIHTALDRQGVPRAGRTVKVTYETTEITLPAGYH